VDYQTALDRFFTGPPDVVPAIAPVAAAAPGRRLRDAIEPIAAHAIWAREVNERCAERGLDFLGAYVFGRAAPLGDVPPALVTATFGVFAPALVEGIYDGARRVADRADVLRIREEATVRSLGDLLGAPTDVEEVTAVLRRGIATADGAGRPLFSALAAQPWPAAPVGALWRACELLREHRGDGHLAVCVAEGLAPVEMNILTELHCGMPLGSYTASRGWSEDDIAAAVRRLDGAGYISGGTLTDAGRDFRAAIEARTDRTQDAVLRGIGDDLEAIVEQLTGWSQQVIDARGFPADPWKRAAG
jgi:hypothetical protein